MMNEIDEAPRRRETDRIVVTGKPVLYLLLAFTGGGIFSGLAGPGGVDCEEVGHKLEMVMQSLRGDWP